MRDVVIVGGGLSGLAAAVELAQYPLDVTLIEVKRHLGGSLQTIQQDNSILDTGAFAIQNSLDSDWLANLGLDNALFHLSDDIVAFKEGTGQLIATMKQKMTATRLMRMAVSSIGSLDNGKYSICMENGLMFDAQSLILAIPARYAERMFYGFINPITEALLDYHYDSIHRVSLVCKTDAIPENLPNPPDMAYSFIHRTTHPARVPDGYTLLQFGIRIEPERLSSDKQLVSFLCERFNLPEPLTSYVGYWAEADPISCFDATHTEWVQSIRAKLPTGVTLIGSDYCLEAPASRGINRLDERIQQGISAAHQILKRRNLKE